MTCDFIVHQIFWAFPFLVGCALLGLLFGGGLALIIYRLIKGKDPYNPLP